MGHPGNWSEEKIASVRRANAQEAWARIAKAVYVDEGGNRYFSGHTPCASFTEWGNVRVSAHCYGCDRIWWIERDQIMHTKFSHRPWREVVRKMRCTACDHPVDRLDFQDTLNRSLGSLVARLPMTPDEVAQLPPQPGLKVVEGSKPEPFKAPMGYWNKRRG